MKTKLVQIGNSRGVRLPKPLIQQANLGDDVELQVQNDRIIISSVRHPRSGWAAAARQAAVRGGSVMKTISVTLVFLLLYGCAALNPYSVYYTDRLNGRSPNSFPYVEVIIGEPEIYSSDDLTRDSQAMRENGYFLIGYSSFNAGDINQNLAFQQAKNVGASIVIVSSKYTNTVSGSIPFKIQNPPKTSYTRESGTIYGGGDTYTYSGSSRTTAPGDYTTYNIPYNVNRSDYFATYWVKTKPPPLGLSVVNIPTDIRQIIKRNRGAFIDVVLNNSPAWYRD